MGAAPEKGFSVAENGELVQYLQAHFTPSDPILEQIVQLQERAGLPSIQLSPFDLQHLGVIIRMIGAKRIVEIGTLGGYSGVSILQAANGVSGSGIQPELHTFEVRSDHGAVAEKAFALAGVTHQVTLYIGDAHLRLREIEERGPFDLLFIDADKAGYPDYLDWGERNLRPGGVVVADNVFLKGKLISGESSAVLGMRKFIERVSSGVKWHATVLPTGDGLLVAVRL